ncbi:hypothetical protein OSTOST_11841 [Ostertagia ostertagi]
MQSESGVTAPMQKLEGRHRTHAKERERTNTSSVEVQIIPLTPTNFSMPTLSYNSGNATQSQARHANWTKVRAWLVKVKVPSLQLGSSSIYNTLYLR